MFRNASLQQIHSWNHEAGFELVAAKQGDCGLTIGYWRTGQPTNQRNCCVGFVGFLGLQDWRILWCKQHIAAILWSDWSDLPDVGFSSYFDSESRFKCLTKSGRNAAWLRQHLVFEWIKLWTSMCSAGRKVSRRRGQKWRRPFCCCIVYQLRSSSCTKKTEGFQQFFPFKPSTFFTKIWGSESDFVRFLRRNPSEWIPKSWMHFWKVMINH